jgi:hypothetical protein
MRARIRVAREFRDRLFVLTVVSVLVVATLGIPGAGQAIQGPEGEAEGARVRIVHGVANAGPLDIYVDGSLALFGIVFGDTSGDVVLPGGEHAFAVVPTGGTPETAIAAGTIALDNDGLAYAALLGTLDSASVGLFEVDDRPLDQGRARFRIINGVPDAGEITPILGSETPRNTLRSMRERMTWISSRPHRVCRSSRFRRQRLPKERRPT